MKHRHWSPLPSNRRRVACPNLLQRLLLCFGIRRMARTMAVHSPAVESGRAIWGISDERSGLEHYESKT